MARGNRHQDSRGGRGSRPSRGNGRGRGTFSGSRGRITDAQPLNLYPDVRIWPEVVSWQEHRQANGVSDNNPLSISLSANYSRGRGRARDAHSFSIPSRASSFHARGGRGSSSVNPTAPLSHLLYSERPLLQPVKFVRSSYTPTLFQTGEDILQPMAEEVGDGVGLQNHTAVRMKRLLSGELSQLSMRSSSSSDELEEVDFNDMGQFLVEGDATTKQQATSHRYELEVPLEDPEGDDDGNESLAVRAEDVIEASRPLVQQLEKPQEQEEEQEEMIVYEAPYPRLQSSLSPGSLPKAVEKFASQNMPICLSPSTVKASPELEAPVSPSISTFKFSFSSAIPASEQPKVRAGPKGKLLHRQIWARAMRRKEHKQGATGSFGLFGAILEEQKLQCADDEKDPRWKERRREDSDLDWGDEGNDAEEDDGGMQVDPDLDITAMADFVKGMSMEGGRFMTTDVIGGEEEDGDEGDGDESTDNRTDDDEEECACSAEERKMLGESSSEELDSSDSDASPDTRFQAKLERVRRYHQSKELVNGYKDQKGVEGTLRMLLDAEAMPDCRNWIFDDEHSNADQLSLFRAVRNGNFDGLEGFNRSRKGKGRDIPLELEKQWSKDRLKKAERKRARERERLERAANPFSAKKGGKKGRKAMLAAKRLDDAAPLPNRIVDKSTLVQQIRKFTAELGGNQTMALPPMTKEERQIVHQLALAFKLKSKSHGYGDGRYVSLIKTSRTFEVDERKVAKILGQSRVTAPRHKEGDEVGKAAPKIGDTNIGFRMLASMGWSEGDRIGTRGGLDAPLTAVIKHTKLGLGAK